MAAWRLAGELQQLANATCDKPLVRRDFKFESQLRDAAASGPRNIAEGFGRFRPAPFAQFMEFAIGSTMETKVGVKDGIDRGYYSPTRAERALSLAERSIQVSTKLMLYLKSQIRS